MQLVLTLWLAPVAASDVQAVSELDLERYSGQWFEIARFPNSFQADCTGDVTATYSLLQNGRISVLNRCRAGDSEWKEAEGIARLAEREGPASRLKVRFAPGWLSFLPFVWADYWVLALDDDYGWAAVGTPDRKYLWVLSRTPNLEEATYEAVIEKLEGMGFDAARLVKTNHSSRNGSHPAVWTIPDWRSRASHETDSNP